MVFLLLTTRDGDVAARKVVLLFAFAHLPLFALPVVYFWSVLCFLTFDSLIGACAAVAKNAEQANAAYLPFQATLCMFNGERAIATHAKMYFTKGSP
eukprot:2704962-Amphidinium_carterae.2